MNGNPITITAAQRQPIYELIFDRLAKIDSVFVLLANDMPGDAEDRGLEFGEDLRFLHDIGWAQDDPRDVFELTRSPEDLTEALKRLAAEADSGTSRVSLERRGLRPGGETTERYACAGRVGRELMASLDRRAKPTLTISREQRDSLQLLMAYRFFYREDLRMARLREQGVSHEQIVSEFYEDRQLMTDLGWLDRRLLKALYMPDGDRHEFELTMRPEALARTLRRAREGAKAGPERGLRQSPNETAEERSRRFQVAEQNCNDLLAQLDQREEAPV